MRIVLQNPLVAGQSQSPSLSFGGKALRPDFIRVDGSDVGVRHPQGQPALLRQQDDLYPGRFRFCCGLGGVVQQDSRQRVKSHTSIPTRSME